MAPFLLKVNLLLTFGVFVSAYPTVEYMSSSCGTSYNVYSSKRIKLNIWPTSSSCTVTFVAKSSYHVSSNAYLSARFRSIDLAGSSFGTCTKRRVDIFDSDGIILTSSSGTCGRTIPYPATYQSSGNTLQVRFKVLQSSILQSGSFDILITRYALGICNSNEYQCLSSGRCVSYGVTCDGYQDCSDDSDEINACGLSTGVISGAVVAGIFGFIFFILIIAAVYRRRTYGRVLWTSSVPYNQSCTTTTTTSAQVFAPPPYGAQPAYPQPQQYPGAYPK